MERWHNRVAVVTGASAGIGAAICKILLANGMIVVGLARRVERLEELRTSLPAEQRSRFHMLRCDVSKEEDIVETFNIIVKQLHGIDVLVNNAGVFHLTPIIAENNSNDMKDTVNTNILGPAFCTREAYRSMKERNFDGHIININSVVGHGVPYVPNTNLNMYSATKHAITGMTEVLRQEFNTANTRIKVTSISPGAVQTDLINDLLNSFATFSALTSEDVASAVLFCIQTPPSVQVHEMIIKPIGEPY